MKKVLSFILSVIIVLTMPTASFAEAMINMPNVEVKTNQEYAFTYTEYTDTDNSIIRTYSKQDSPAISTFARVASNHNTDDAKTEQERTKAVLTSLGMSQAFVNELSEEDLDEYANSPQITSVVSYTKTDEDGNVTNVPEDEALAVTSVDPEFSFGNDEGGGGGYPSHTTTEIDTYMKMVFIVTELGGGRYKYSVDAEWLTMPYWRLRDCIGIAVQNSSVSYGSFAGWCSYTTTYSYILGTLETENIYYDFTDDYFAEPTSSSWDGGAATFGLPANETNDVVSIVHSKFKVHFECEATVVHPQLTTVFNTTASYDHSIVTLDWDLGVDLAAQEGMMSCVLGGSMNSETRVVCFDEPFTYNP